MQIGALQSGYLPWLGYFEQIARCDLFVIYDDLQYTRKDWRNRNRIKTPQGAMWLSVPVHAQTGRKLGIDHIRIVPNQNWAGTHWRALRTNYARAPYFDSYTSYLQLLYRRPWKFLAELNREVLQFLLDRLGIRTPVLYSSEHHLEQEFCRWQPNPDATDRIVFLCRHFGAEHFLEGSAGRNYIDRNRIEQTGVRLHYQDYVHPRYRQLFGEFIPYLSIVDLLFNEGERSLEILRSGDARAGIPR